MSDIEQWQKEHDAHMAMIGQTIAVVPKQTTKKEEE